MSGPKKSNLPDPDYELTEVAREHVKLKEDAENQETLEKIIDIIKREFKTELAHRQSQIDLIQKRLNKAQKTLHLLKYVLINTYYNEQHLFVQSNEEPNGEDQFISNKSRLHPAVSNLTLGVNVTDYQMNSSESPRKKMKYINPSSQSLTIEPFSDDNNKKSVIENISIENTISHIKPPIISEDEYIRNRKKTKYRIVVGNISKWMPSDSAEDKSTHRWMVYVRGSKESPDISHFVEKVVFYLHPSYQPNDVVELRHPPFHLSRRGWGEFPLRVKLFFQYALNKPVDIIHNLKLDKTFTGQQTLGNETVVNLFLFKNEKTKPQDNEDFQIPIIKQEIDDTTTEFLNSNIDLKNVTHEEAKYLEHDYCSVGLSEQVKENLNFQFYDFHKEHSYARTKLSPEHNKNELENNEGQPSNNLMYGINDSTLKNTETIAEIGVGSIKLINEGGTTFAIKTVHNKPQESLLKKNINRNTSQLLDSSNSRLVAFHSQQEVTDSKSSIHGLGVTINYKKYHIDLPRGRFKNAYQALSYLFKRMPFITQLAADLDYKCTYPYAAQSLKEYCNWNIGRRLSSEWFQAKMILKMLRDANLKDYHLLTPKFLIMYGRSRGYTPMANYEILKNNSITFMSVLDNVANNLPIEDRAKLPTLMDSDVVVDIMNYTGDENKSDTNTCKIKLVDQKMDGACSFVKQVAFDAGIVLKPHELIPGVLFNGAERMLVQAILSLAEDVIRAARINAILKGNYEKEGVVTTEDVRKALRQSSRLKFLSKVVLNTEETC
ncbi:hypothetical protein FQA39_LY09970 [Lamprigera yunnana]|nr:hypothetical protein FQA39_LY09970 [Lamprigera yunnana]